MSRILRERMPRVEGHGGIEVEISDGQVTAVRFHIYEGMRRFEELLVGRSYEEITPIVSRICAICSVGHTLTSLQAIEKAFAVKVTPQTQLLRELLFLGQVIESHALHLFCLAVPDYLGYSGIIPMAREHAEVVTLGLRIKKLGNSIQTLIGGRAIHPVNAVVGGFGKIPSADDLAEVWKELQEIGRGIEAGVAFLVKTLAGVPGEKRQAAGRPASPPGLYAALRPAGDEFGFFGEEIVLSSGEKFPVAEYRRLCQEEPVPHAHAQHSRFQGKPFMVGALARLNLFGDRLRRYADGRRESCRLWSFLLDTFPAADPLANNLAQGVELFYALTRAEEIISHLLAEGLRPEPPATVKPAAGKGTAATEVPRGTLYHGYTFDGQGIVIGADVVTPTAQNLADMEEKVRDTCQRLLGRLPEEQILPQLEMVVRAYDPCISCSVHLIRKK